MAQVGSHVLLTAEAWAQFQVSPRDICGGQSGTETGFSLNTFVLPCLCHSTNALHSSSSHSAPTGRANGRTLGNFQKAMFFRKSWNTKYKITFAWPLWGPFAFILIQSE